MITDINEQKQDKTDTLKKGYVYCIRSFQTENIYIGSTFQRLSKRFYEHKQCHRLYYNTDKQKTKCTTSSKILIHDDAYIELIKEVKVNNRQELRKYEGEEQRKNKNILVNIQFENPTAEERKAQKRKSDKKYYENNKDKFKKYEHDNKEKIRKRRKDYYDNNKEVFKEKYKEYRQEYYKENKEKRIIINKKYRENNKEKIKELRKKYYRENKDKVYNCEICNISIKYWNKYKHNKTIKHLNNVNIKEKIKTE